MSEVKKLVISISMFSIFILAIFNYVIDMGILSGTTPEVFTSLNRTSAITKYINATRIDANQLVEEDVGGFYAILRGGVTVLKTIFSSVGLITGLIYEFSSTLGLPDYIQDNLISIAVVVLMFAVISYIWSKKPLS